MTGTIFLFLYCNVFDNFDNFRSTLQRMLLGNWPNFCGAARKSLTGCGGEILPGRGNSVHHQVYQLKSGGREGQPIRASSDNCSLPLCYYSIFSFGIVWEQPKPNIKCRKVIVCDKLKSAYKEPQCEFKKASENKNNLWLSPFPQVKNSMQFAQEMIRVTSPSF